MQKQGKFESKPGRLASVSKMMPTELQIENGIIAWATYHGFGIWKTKNKGERHTKFGIDFFKKSANPGFQDLTLCVRGRFVAIEVKRPDNKQTELQKLHQKSVEKCGGIYLVCTSSIDAEKQFKERGLL